MSVGAAPSFLSLPRRRCGHNAAMTAAAQVAPATANRRRRLLRASSRHRPSPGDPRYTKIVATIGPASEDHLPELIDAGLSVARLNFSHGTAAEHRRRMKKIRAASAGA